MPTPNFSPCFDVPLGPDPLDARLLKGRRILALYELNRQDFVDVIAIFYTDLIHDPDPGAVTNRKKGFDAFCELLEQFLAGAPSSNVARRRSPSGEYENFFGEAILDHLEAAKFTFQDLYGSEASERYNFARMLLNRYARYVAIDVFRVLSAAPPPDIAAARQRISQLKAGARTLKAVPAGQPPSSKPFTE